MCQNFAARSGWECWKPPPEIIGGFSSFSGRNCCCFFGALKTTKPPFQAGGGGATGPGGDTPRGCGEEPPRRRAEVAARLSTPVPQYGNQIHNEGKVAVAPPDALKVHFSASGTPLGGQVVDSASFHPLEKKKVASGRLLPRRSASDWSDGGGSAGVLL